MYLQLNGISYTEYDFKYSRNKSFAYCAKSESLLIVPKADFTLVLKL